MIARPTLAALAIAAIASIPGCKLKLTPENIGETFHNIQDAQKDLTPENEYYIGRSVATNLLARKDYRYSDRDALLTGRLTGLTEYVNLVGTVVAVAAMETPREGDRPAPIAGWHFVVIEDDVINGVSAPGGTIFVTTAAVRAARSEDELAALLAHEVAHVMRGHAIGSIKKSRWAGVTKQAIDSSVTLDEQALGSLTEAFDGAMDDMLDALLVKGYSRDSELEADRVAVEILVRAGYDARALTSYLTTLAATQQPEGGGFSATHPKPSERIDSLAEPLRRAPTRGIIGARTARFEAATRTR